MPEPVTLRTLLGDYPGTTAIRSGALRSPLFDMAFAPHASPAAGFKAMVRDLAYDTGELALVTFLQARAAGKPLVLMPATVLGRPQHHCLVYNADRGRLTPRDLAGKTIGVRSWTQTTGMWVRGILAEQYGIDLSGIRWLTFEGAHVAEYEAPPEVTLAGPGDRLGDMLLDGRIDAIIGGRELPDDPRLRTVIPDPEAAARDWTLAHGAVPINHMMVVQRGLADSRPDVVREIFRLLRQARDAGGAAADPAMHPFGLDAVRPSIELAIDYSLRQGLIRQAPRVEDLFDDTTRDLV